MKILLATFGSRGDVQPFIALACALQRAGHEPIMVGAPHFSKLTDQYGIEFLSIFNSAQTAVSWSKVPDLAKSMKASKVGPRRAKLKAQLTAITRDMHLSMLEQITKIARDFSVNAIVHRGGFPWHHVAEGLAIPEIIAFPDVLFLPTESFPSPYFSARLLPEFCNEFTFRAVNELYQRKFGKKSIDRWLSENLGLSLIRNRHDFLRTVKDCSTAPALQAVSRYLLPPSAKYPNWVKTTGFWYAPIPDRWKPGNDLLRFLNTSTNKPLVVVSLGITSRLNPRTTTSIITQAIRSTNTRVLFVGGSVPFNIDSFAEDMFHLDEAPLEFLLPYASVALHHGGIGTTGAALVAGCPQIIVPNSTVGWIKRQLQFNAEVMHIRGVTASPRTGSILDIARLSEEIRESISNTRIVNNARELAGKVQQEEGVSAAVEAIEALV